MRQNLTNDAGHGCEGSEAQDLAQCCTTERNGRERGGGGSLRSQPAQCLSPLSMALISDLVGRTYPHTLLGHVSFSALPFVQSQTYKSLLFAASSASCFAYSFPPLVEEVSVLTCDSRHIVVRMLPKRDQEMAIKQLASLEVSFPSSHDKLTSFDLWML